MSNLESRLTKLEAVQQTPRRQYTDTERAVRYAYLLAQGGPLADRLRSLVEKVPEDDHAKP
ncbi:MAG TPA: hypothetical protein PLB25_03080 [Rhodoferax sp.]|nr:hypothetical protein [Rhodoferax sp.]